MIPGGVLYTYWRQIRFEDAKDKPLNWVDLPMDARIEWENIARLFLAHPGMVNYYD